MRSLLTALQSGEALPVTSPGTVVATSEHVAGAAVGLGAGDLEEVLEG